MNLPNTISLGRLLCVPLAVWLINGDQLIEAFWVFAAVAATDALDGYLARRFDERTTLGSYLDPLADKALLVSVFVALGLHGHIPMWLVTLVVLRDVLIVGGTVLQQVLRGGGGSIRPLWISKLNTLAQIVLAGVVLASAGGLVPLPEMRPAMVLLVAITTVLSGAAYVARWVGAFQVVGEGRP